MGDIKQVKVDNWGAFFLQRLKHFFNRTDYCDLTLQFQDNAQLKVHRLVLNACTEYFEVLEGTCEMYEDCLIMPDDLQADVVVPIVNFMYTGQLEYKWELLDKLYQTAQIMNMSVLTKLLDAHRTQPDISTSITPKYKQLNNPNNYTRSTTGKKVQPSTSYKKNTSTPSTSTRIHSGRGMYLKESMIKSSPTQRKRKELPARPTRYEVPEELEKDDYIQFNSFESISYDSKPLMTHPKNEFTSKSHYSGYESSASKRFDNRHNILKRSALSTNEDIEFKRIKSSSNAQLFSEPEDFNQYSDSVDDLVRPERKKTNDTHSFDHVVNLEGAKVTIATKSSSDKPIDHAKIISEVLKKYPHLVKNNKNIKLKIVNTPAKSAAKRIKTPVRQATSPIVDRNIKKERSNDYMYETDISDTKEIGKLISLGIENVTGPWLCLICGTPGKALNFSSYRNFRNHLVEIHNEKQPSNMCEFCGIKSGKRNHLLHHIYTKHGVPPPPSYHFPKCNRCPYIALTQAYLTKHKLTHAGERDFTCNVCQKVFKGPSQLLDHIQQSGHKVCPDRKANLQCIYCLKTFLRETNYYTHLKVVHKVMARRDGIIDDSDEEADEANVKMESYQDMDNDESDDIDDEQYAIPKDSGEYSVNKKLINSPNQKILNQSLLNQSVSYTHAPNKTFQKNLINKFSHRVDSMTVPIEYNEQIVLNPMGHLQQNSLNQATSDTQQEYIISDVVPPESQIEDNFTTMTSVEVHPQHIHNNELPNDETNIDHPYQIVVSSEQEYKALMASKPSIIFQGGSHGKAVTVMRHSTDLGTQNIDLNTTDNSNMMILEDNYPINVSEALTVDNSNIVVVYSHNLSSQDGMQFSEHLVDQASQQVITSMGNEMQQTILVEQPVQEWHNEEQVLQSQGLQTETITSYLPLRDNSVIKPNEIDNMAIVVDKGLSDATELEIVGHNDGIINEVVITQPSEVLPETEIENVTETQFNTDQIGEQMHMQEVPVQTIIPNNNTESLELQEQSISEIDVENQEQVSSMVTLDTTLSSLEENISGAPIDENADVSMESESSQGLTESESAVLKPTIIKERIQELAAEWSDDESPKVQTQEDITHNVNPNSDDNVVPCTETSTNEASEIEESIENIQEEVLKPSNVDKKIIITSDITLPKSTTILSKSSNMGEQTQLYEANETSKNKVCTILNDWDENDSQPEQSAELELKSSEKVPEAEDEKVPCPDTTDDEKAKGLKNIISDWDDDEEVKE